MLVPLLLLNLLLPSTLAAPHLKARDCQVNEIPASLTDAYIDRNNKNNVSFRVYSEDIETRCPPLDKDPQKNTAKPFTSKNVYECTDPSVTFRYNGDNGQLRIWINNDQGSFGGSVTISNPSSEVISTTLKCQDN
ncbi:uncharacterized protein FSUBG_11435 [Fusarium subglutinans]|uniref:AA1-like domain-containing protein n=1 Tax=Gibberella subglutinans TaxID=42677 RepID=A0A8H5P547_GIBSU|nr:uncharacterized protein FSUBG_11435 [Fusarium subglutinans]KAF5588578.1 hypothetical protein FSUBG_11435 [Fusarium subglutinans]